MKCIVLVVNFWEVWCFVGLELMCRFWLWFCEFGVNYEINGSSVVVFGFKEVSIVVYFWL